MPIDLIDRQRLHRRHSPLHMIMIGGFPRLQRQRTHPAHPLRESQGYAHSARAILIWFTVLLLLLQHRILHNRVLAACPVCIGIGAIDCGAVWRHRVPALAASATAARRRPACSAAGSLGTDESCLGAPPPAPSAAPMTVIGAAWLIGRVLAASLPRAGRWLISSRLRALLRHASLRRRPLNRHQRLRNVIAPACPAAR